MRSNKDFEAAVDDRHVFILNTFSVFTTEMVLNSTAWQKVSRRTSCSVCHSIIYYLNSTMLV